MRPTAPPTGGSRRSPRRSAPPPRNPIALVLLAAGGLAGMATVAWVMGGDGGNADAAGHERSADDHDHDHDHGHDAGAGAPVEVVDVVASMTAPLSGGSGEVAVTVTAHVPAGTAGAGPDSVPAGVPLTLSVSLPPDVAEVPDLSLHLRSPGGAGPGEAVPLDRPEVFLLNTTDGSLALPAGAAAHDHGAGRSLTQGMPGGGFAWATSLSPDPATVVLDRSGRWLAAAHPDDGAVELVDLLARSEPVALALTGGPDRLWFTPEGSLWAGGSTSGEVHVVDPAAARVTASFTLPHGADHAAFTDDGALAAMAGGDTVSFIAADGRPPASTRVAAEVAAVTFAPAAGGSGSFALAHPDGAVTLLPVAADGTVEDGALVEVGPAGAGTVAIATAADGRTVVTANQSSDSLSLVDAATGALLAVVPAGEAPVEVAFLDHFAVARNAGSAEVTWVDLQDPTKSGNEALGAHPVTSMAIKADGSEILLASPMESRVFLLHSMMGRPMVMGTEESATAADVVLSTRSSLRPVSEAEPHEHDGDEPPDHAHRVRYEHDAVLHKPGEYELTVQVGPGTATVVFPVAPLQGPRVVVTPIDAPAAATVGEPVKITFTSTGPQELDEPEVLAVLRDARGISQLRVPARPIGGGRYVAEVVPTRPGRWSVTLLAEASGVNPATSEPALLDVAVDG